MWSVSLLPKTRFPESVRRRVENLAPPPAYAAGLVSVALAAIVIPAHYAALVALIAYGLYRHLMAHAGWIAGSSASLGLGLLYLTLGMILAMTLFFLLRPCLPRRRKGKGDIIMPDDAEPRLHAFVRDVCISLGAPVPVRILANMEVNASARFMPGPGNVLRGRLELMIGLPLVRCMDLGQFAGVLAHELGHFRQGAGMRMVHGIRSVNQWFATAAVREDAWEPGWSNQGHRLDPLVYVPLAAAKVCASVIRLVLKGHLRVGQAASCLLLRQMEFEADRCAVRTVGGECFAGMVLEAKILESAWALANRSLGMALREGRLADDLPALVAAHTRVFIPEVRRKMERSLMREPTAWFDTHPSLSERVRRARGMPGRGLFRSGDPASSLFTDFASLSRAASMAFYRMDLGEDFNPSRMVSTSDLVTGQSEVQVGEAAVTGYFLGYLTNLRPIWVGEEDFRGEPDRRALTKRLQSARGRLESVAAGMSERYQAFAQADFRLLDAVQAQALIRANFWIEPGDFQLERGGVNQAAQAFLGAEADQRRLAKFLDPFESDVRTRLATALRLVGDAEVGLSLPDAQASATEVTRMLPCLEVLAKAYPRLVSMRRSLHGMGILLENLEGNAHARELHAQLRAHGLAIRLDLEALAVVFAATAYPFGFSGPTGTLGEYALDPLPSENDFAGHYAAAEEALGRCYALYFRIMGRLALTAGRVEGVLGLGPLRVGDAA